MRTEIFQWELNNGSKITNATKRDFYRKLEIEITNKCIDINKKIDEYVKEHSDEEEVIRRQESTKNETIGIGKDIERGIKENTEIQLQNEADIEGLPKSISMAKEELKLAVKEAAYQLKHTQSNSYWKENHEELDRQFNELWDKKSKQLEKEFQKSKITEEDIEKACDRSIRKLMIGTEHSKAYADEIRRKYDKDKQLSPWEKNKLLVNWFRRYHIASNDELDKVQNVVIGIVNRHKTDLIYHAKVKQFQQSRVDTILYEVYNALAQSNVNSESVVRTLLTVQNEICTVCKDCQLKYDSHNSLQKMFANEKESLKDYFRGFVDETIWSGAAARR
ncbi:hypothetical protein BSL78_09524 [Apostichopus japonicus]|uniref:Uncharacterized protein n=1 Tax=Stichopus japonicus TaxID=307972 RepID=A0A2G8L012_STIJA|nr:hypothetical protein BSL78_09524 [Apostichopus japonicus]